MKKAIPLFLAAAICILSCGKDTAPINAGNPQNKIGTIVDSSGFSFDISCSGNNTLFSYWIDTLHADTAISITGGIAPRSIAIDLFNITQKGTYTIGDNGPSGSSGKIVRLRYQLGTILTGGITFNAQSFRGSITIDSISANYIKGNFYDTCWNSTNNNYVVLKNGTFQGEF